MLVLVLEASTTSAKAMLYDDARGVVRMDSAPYAPDVSDVYTHDPDRLYASLLRVGRQAAGEEAADVCAVALVGSWHTALACDKALRPLSRVITWNSPAAVQTAARIRSDAALTEALYRTTGCMPHAIYPLYMMRYLRESGFDGPDVRFSTEGDYLFYRMSGQRRLTVSSASGASLLDSKRLAYGELPLQTAGVTPAQLPALCDHTYTAPLCAEAAALLGLRAGIPVCPSNPDGAMNQLGCAALSPGIMTLSVGTSAAMRMADPDPDMAKLAGTWCYYAPGTWLVGAATSGATNCVDWFMHAAAAGLDFATLEDNLCIRADSPGFLPFLYGERCPGWNDGAAGSFYGLLGKHTRQDLYAGLLEGVTFNIVQCFRQLCAHHGSPRRILLSGGVLKSDFWTGMLVDALGQDVELSQMEQASMLGGAAIALYACGRLSSPLAFHAQEASPRLRRPDPARTAFFQTRYAAWLYWYQAQAAYREKLAANEP